MRSNTLIAVGLLAVSPTLASAQAESYAVSGRDVAIYNLAGSAEIVRGSGSEVRVYVTRGGDDAEALEVEVGRLDGVQTLRVIYPDDRVVYGGRGRWGGNTNVRVRDDGRFFGGIRGGDRVSIHGSGRGLEAWADLRIEMPANQDLDLYVAVGEVTSEDTDGDLLISVGSAPVESYRHVGPLVIDTGSGKVVVDDVDGDLLVDTGSGGVDIANVRGGSVDIDTGSGSIEGDGVSTETARFDTGSGSVRIDRLLATDVLVDTGSGSVFLDLESDVADLTIDTGSGAVTLVVPDELGAQIELDSGSGGIDVEVPVRVGRSERNYLRGVVGDGNGEIEIDTGSGRIRIQAR